MLDTTESITVAAVTLITNTLTAVFTSRASAAKTRKEGDALISDTIAKRTQQLFDNLSHVVEEQQKEINGLKASLETCHQQHGEAMRQHNETLRRLEALEAKVVR